jgi:acetyltransferase-like isoleucine patch superfamily enzyme
MTQVSDGSHEDPGILRRLGLKRVLGAGAGALARLAILPLLITCNVRAILVGDSAFVASSQLLSLIPGLFGDCLRREFHRSTLAACGTSVQIVFGSFFSSRSATVGDNVYIGSHCVIGDADIESDVLLGSNVHLLSGRAQHGIADPLRPIRLQPRRFDRIRIGEDTWIGNQSIIMANVGRKCVIGAGSVVVSDVPDYSIAAGNPAKVLRSREAQRDHQTGS